jgi:hypothetical protein
MFGVIASPAYADAPKQYGISLSEARIGTTAVDGGQYKLLVHRDEPKVQLMVVRTGEILDLTGKVENTESKYQRTEIISETADGVKLIREIRVGGARLRLDFRPQS